MLYKLSLKSSIGIATLCGDTVVTHYSIDFKLYKTEPRGSFHSKNMITQIIECLLKYLKWLNVRQLIMFDTAVLVYKSRNEQVPIRTFVMFQNFEVSHRFYMRLAALGVIHYPGVPETLAREA